jgi:hypothetical protein
MNIRQVLALEGSSQAIDSFLLDLEQLGLQILPNTSTHLEGQEQMIVGDEDALSSSVVLATIRQALNQECCVLLDPKRFPGIINEIRQTGGLSDNTRNDLAAYARYRCI